MNMNVLGYNRILKAKLINLFTESVFMSCTFSELLPTKPVEISKIKGFDFYYFELFIF